MKTTLTSQQSNEIQALGVPRRKALERLTAALSEALTLKRKIDKHILSDSVDGCTLDFMRQLHWLCKSEMLNLKSYCHLFSGTKTFIGFYKQFHILLEFAAKMLSNQGRPIC